MHNETLFAIVACAMFLALLIPSNAWIYNDFMQEEWKYDDTRFEMFGPRADRLLIKLYANAEAEWSAFENCDLDLTDWPLTQYRYAQFASPPWSDLINVVSYGSDFDLATLEINNNNNQYLGNPPNPLYPNPLYPNPCSVLSFRQAIAHICNRAYIINTMIMPGFAYELYTPVVPSQDEYMNLDIRPGGTREDLCYLYNTTEAAALLTADGFPVNPSTGWRYWDRNGNAVQDLGEAFTLKFVVRIDCDGIAGLWGWYLASQLEALGIKVNIQYMAYVAANVEVKQNKNFHLYTEIRWIDTPHPNQLINWHWGFHWHPGSPPNYGGCHNSAYNADVDSFLHASDQAEAVMWAQQAQVDYAANVLSVPLFCYAGNMAVKRRYSGGEAQYTGEWWEGIVNIEEVGPDNYWSFLNMHTQCHPWGDCSNMTIRKGFLVPELKSLNPIYAYGLWEREILDLIYEPLVRRDPYNYSAWVSWMVKQYQAGTYLHPVYGNCSQVTFTLRPDIYWSDGYPLTVTDVYFTFVELRRLLVSRGLPMSPCLEKELRDILDFKILDPCNFLVLFDSKTVWALDWLGKIPILPKHIWKPIVTSGYPTAFAPDPNVIGSGPWRLKEYVPYSDVLMVKNSPGSTVQTNLPNSTYVTSLGFFRYHPVYVNVHGDSYRQKFTPLPASATINFTITDLLQYEEYVHMCNVSSVPLDTTGWNPIDSMWHLPWRDPTTNATYKCEWQVIDYKDQHGPAGLSPSDLILIQGMSPDMPPIWVHVTDLWVDISSGHSGHTGPHLEMNVDNFLYEEKYIYLDDELIKGPIYEEEKPNSPIVRQSLLAVLKGMHRLKVAERTRGDPGTWREYYLCSNNEEAANKWHNTWANVTLIFWVTIPEDVASNNTYYTVIGVPLPASLRKNDTFPVPDCKVDIQDLARVVAAYGSYPGHDRWNPVCDVTCDFRIDIQDLSRVSGKYGWH